MFLGKNLFKKIFSFAVLVYSPQLFSAEVKGNADTSTQRDLTSDEVDQIKQLLNNQPLKPYSVNVYGLLQGNFNFVDTVRNNTPDFTVTHARVGVFAIESVWSGKLELEFIGNQPRVLAPTGGPTFLNQSGNNTVTVRQAQINFDFFQHTSPEYSEKMPIFEKKAGIHTVPATPATAPTTGAETPTAITETPPVATVHNTYITRFSIGGIRVGGALSTAPDSANTPSGYGRQDGAYLVENMTFGKQSNANLGFGVFNTLVALNAGAMGDYQGWGINSTTSPNFLGILGITSSSFSKAFLLNAGYTYNFTPNSFLNIAGFYGFQNAAAVNVNTNGFAITERNATHIEASVLYNNTKLFGRNALLSGNGVALYFEQEIGSDQHKTAAAPTPFPEEIGPLNDGYNHMLYGLSLGGDSEGYFSGFLKGADRVIYSTSFTFVAAQFKHTPYSPNYTLAEVAAAVGYGYKSFEIEITAAYTKSPETPITNFKVNSPIAEPTESDNNFTAYLTAALFF